VQANGRPSDGSSIAIEHDAYHVSVEPLEPAFTEGAHGDLSGSGFCGIGKRLSGLRLFLRELDLVRHRSHSGRVCTDEHPRSCRDDGDAKSEEQCQL
jgi:hypothetical protein